MGVPPVRQAPARLGPPGAVNNDEEDHRWPWPALIGRRSTASPERSKSCSTGATPPPWPPSMHRTLRSWHPTATWCRDARHRGVLHRGVAGGPADGHATNHQGAAGGTLRRPRLCAEHRHPGDPSVLVIGRSPARSTTSRSGSWKTMEDGGWSRTAPTGPRRRSLHRPGRNLKGEPPAAPERSPNESQTVAERKLSGGGPIRAYEPRRARASLWLNAREWVAPADPGPRDPGATAAGGSSGHSTLG